MSKLNGMDTAGSWAGSSNPFCPTGGSSGRTSNLLGFDGSDTMSRVRGDDCNDGEGYDDDCGWSKCNSSALESSTGADGDCEGCGCDGDVDVFLHCVAPFHWCVSMT